MPPSLLFDISDVDLDQIMFDAGEIEKTNPHRGDMRHIDSIVHVNDDWSEAIARKDVNADEFWVSGHIPGRPLLPGVLMLEASAQLCSFVTLRRLGKEQFLGFIGADNVKFRAQVHPGDRLYLLAKRLKFGPRRYVSDVQGLVDG